MSWPVLGLGCVITRWRGVGQPLVERMLGGRGLHPAIFGFLASNRTAVAKHIAKIEATDAGQLDWLRNQTMAKGHNTQQKETFFIGQTTKPPACGSGSPA